MNQSNKPRDLKHTKTSAALTVRTGVKAGVIDYPDLLEVRRRR